MMSHLIFRPTRREQEERLQERTPAHLRGQVRGGVRTLEEAMEIRRQHERAGEPFTQPYAALDGPEVRQAYEDEMLRAGVNPETNERIKPRKFITPWGWAKPLKGAG